MLQAITHRKYRFPLKGREDDTVQREATEDLITSTVFGPLAYFAPTNLKRVFEILLGKHDLGDSWSTDNPETAAVDFWPNIAAAGRTEPDLRVNFIRRGQTYLTVLVEFKWGSSPTMEQLREQWKKLGSAQTHAIHILLTRDPADFAEQLESRRSAPWNGRFVHITWHEIAQRLADISVDQDRGIANWANDVSDFLTCLEISAFCGFGPYVLPPGNYSFLLGSWFSMLSPSIVRIPNWSFHAGRREAIRK